jgi:uncharacterized membrane protein YccC
MANSPQTLPPPAQASGFQYALRILIGGVIVWIVLDRLNHHNPLWAIISVITVTEPAIGPALLAFYSRIVNTLIGCAVGLFFLFFLGPAIWWVLLGIGVSIVICTQVIHVPVSWRIAPITVAIVMTPSILTASRAAGLPTAVERTEEVLLGSAVALLVTYSFSRLQRWLRSNPA